MSDLLAIPEIQALDRGTAAIRIPNQQQIPLTDRVRRLIDTAEFRRLANISQLGLVSLVYPGARHSRFEHCLGVYRMALLFLRHFALDHQFDHIVSRRDAELFIAAALLHDLAHWPFCHAVEDLELPEIPQHEQRFLQCSEGTEVERCLRQDWQLECSEIADLLQGQPASDAKRILNSMLCGPIDVDKMDYLYRDSLHCGVPYGQNFDSQRLLGSLCLNLERTGIAINDKGLTAAELMVFARYVMFSEVYWHHAVRSATAMFQRAFFELRSHLRLEAVFNSTEPELMAMIKDAASGNHDCQPLVQGILGERRQLYKRLAQYSCFENEPVYQRLARRPFPWLIECGKQLGQLVSQATGQTVAATDILVDSPPAGLEVQFSIDVYMQKTGQFRPLGEISPVVNTLATTQFDDLVKRVRIFVNPQCQAALSKIDNLDELVLAASQAVAS